MPKRLTWESEKFADIIISKYNSGMSAQTIVNELNLSISVSTLCYWLKKWGVEIRKTGPQCKKNCDGCGKILIIQQGPSKNKRGSICLECAPTNSWAQRFYNLGITKPEFDSLFEKQSGLCDLCEFPLSDNFTDIAVDHCHKQGHIRGLLHPKCNTGLGIIEDDKFLAQAIRYIERHKR